VVVSGEDVAVSLARALVRVNPPCGAAWLVAVVVVDETPGAGRAKRSVVTRGQLMGVPDKIHIHGGHDAAADLGNQREEFDVAVHGRAEQRNHGRALQPAIAEHLVDKATLAVDGCRRVEVKLAVNKVGIGHVAVHFEELLLLLVAVCGYLRRWDPVLLSVQESQEIRMEVNRLGDRLV